MTHYDFKVLNDKEFEVLVTDLLTKRDGQKYERFKPGRDSGVDGRFFRPDGTEVIVQCKHWPSSPIERVTKHLQDVELPKLIKLKPNRYIVALSHQLSRDDKTRILKTLTPYVATPADILGREDLNDLLSEYKQVELRHFKLWIASTNVLQHLLSKPVLERSAFALQEAQESAHLYIPTANHDRALAKLEQLGTVIITGPAGIGKTTLADNLALHYVSKGFSFIQIAEEIREAESLFQPGETQLFYFDDFLGRNYLEALSGHEGAHIINFIKRISHDRRKRFILTSRTTILNRGKVLMDTFQNNNLERNEFEISFESFSEIDKARILYNHIWHSSLEQEYIDELYKGKRYRLIISHQNYNPRLIRYITDSERLSNCTVSQYWPYCKELLDNPAKVWENPFEAQHDDFGRALILLVTLNGRQIDQNDLAEAFARFIAHPDAKAMNGRRDYLQSLRHLVGSMLSRVMTNKSEPAINLFNPSIGDFVLHRYASDLPSLRAGFSSLRSTSSIRTLHDLVENNLISQAAEKTVLTTILGIAKSNAYFDYAPDYIALILITWATTMKSLSANDEMTISAVKFVVQSDCPYSFADVAEIVNWAYKHSTATTEEVSDFVSSACRLGANSDELQKLADLIRSLPEDLSEKLWLELEDATVEYFSNAVHDEFSDDEVFDSLEPNQTDWAEHKLSHMIETKLDKLGLPISNSAVESIVEAYDVSERSLEYFKPEPDYDYREGHTFSGSGSDAIDDLFERTR